MITLYIIIAHYLAYPIALPLLENLRIAHLALVNGLPLSNFHQLTMLFIPNRYLVNRLEPLKLSRKLRRPRYMRKIVNCGP